MKHLYTSCLRQLFAVFSLSLFVAAPAQSETRLSMTMKDAELADVMDMISREQRINIFVATNNVERVSFNLYDMTVSDAIRSIANAAGLAVEHYDGNYYIVERDEAGKYAPDAITRVQSFELEYARVDEIGGLLTPYLSDYGDITVLSDRNLFIVQDTPAFLRRIEVLVKQLDRRPQQVLIQAQILEITLSNEDSSGLNWSKLFSSNEGTGTFGTQGLNDPTSNGLFFDYATPDITAALNALTSQGRVRTLSTPTLLAIEDIESSVIIGDRRGYSVTTTINQVTTESVEFLESGVILRVTPSVDSENRIMMDINPEVSSGNIDPLTGIPSQTTTEVEARMIVPDGQTIFVGGLIKNRVDESRQGVPVISKIPLLGRLFSNRQEITTNTETIVLITPTIVAPGEAAPSDRTQDSIRRLNDLQQRDASRINSEFDDAFRQHPPEK